MRRYLSISIFVSLVFALNVEDVLSKVKTRYDSISTMEGTFSETASGEVQFKGKFYLKRPDLMRLEVSTPESQLLVYDGKVLWIYMKGEDVVYKAEFTNQLPFPSPFAILKNYKRRYEIENLPDQGDGLVWIRLIPKSEEVFPMPISLGIDPESYLIKKLAGDGQGFELSDVIHNKKLSSKLFSFTPPKGAEVIETPPEPPGEP